MFNYFITGATRMEKNAFTEVKSGFNFTLLLFIIPFFFTACNQEGHKKETLLASTDIAHNLNSPPQSHDKQEKRDIWIDADLAVGKIKNMKFCDVDDGYAILQLLKSDEVRIHGISSVFGNTSMDNATELCKKMATEFTDKEIPVYAGSDEETELSEVESNDAVEAMAAALKKQKLTILALGPATNVGLLLLNYPELKNQIIEVVLVAGRRHKNAAFEIGNRGRRAGDANFEHDPVSFRIMFQAGVPITLCPFEISSKVWVKNEDLKKLKKSGKGAKWLGEKSRPWLLQWKTQGADGFNPFDLLASHYIIQPQDIISEPLNASIKIYPDDTQVENEGAFKFYLICNRDEGYPIRYCYDVVEGFHDKFMKTLIQ